MGTGWWWDLHDPKCVCEKGSLRKNKKGSSMCLTVENVEAYSRVNKVSEGRRGGPKGEWVGRRWREDNSMSVCGLVRRG